MPIVPTQHPTRPPWLDKARWPFPIRTASTQAGPVAYTDVGAGPVLLLVHAGFWSFLWRDVIRELAPIFRCVTLDLPGSGLTGGPTDVDLSRGAAAIDGVVTALDLNTITLVAHDLGGPAALEAAAGWPHRVRALVAANTFSWRPSGPLFVGLLILMGSAPVRTIDSLTGFLPWVTSSRFGVGRHYDRASRRAFRRGVGRGGRQSFHHYMRSARTHDYRRIDACLATLRDRPVLTVFGARNDPLRFQPQWRSRFGDIHQVEVPKGNHFPMCDDPKLFARQLNAWYRDRVSRAG